MGSEDRVIALIDMDCFYVQVEERDQPELKGKPACVVQYKTWKGGGIISVNYEARAQGVTRQMRGDEAREKCPDIILYRVPELRGKADLTKYRDAGKEVIDVLCEYGACVERASIDEAYLDLTEVVNKSLEEIPEQSSGSDDALLLDTHVIGWEPPGSIGGIKDWIKSMNVEPFTNQDLKLYTGAVLVEKMRAAVREKTGFQCSAGIAHNKMLAKLACGVNKPNKQTVMPMRSVEEFFTTLPLKKVRNLGGKLGDVLAKEFNCTTMKDVANISEKILQQKFDDKTGTWLHWYSRGFDEEPVTSRRLPKSIGCNKNFKGNESLSSREEIFEWLKQLCTEVEERLERDKETNNRIAKQLILTVRQDGDERPCSYSRSVPLPTYDHCKMASTCLDLMIKKNSSKQIWVPPVTCIGIAATKFEDDEIAMQSKIDHFFHKREKPQQDDKSELASMENVNEAGCSQRAIYSPAKESSGYNASIDEPADLQEKTSTVFPTAVSIVDGKKGFFARHRLTKTLSEARNIFYETKKADSTSLHKEDPETESLKFPPNLDTFFDESEPQTCEYLNVTNQMHTCSKCGQNLLFDEVQEHDDYHFALELQQQTIPSTSHCANTQDFPPASRKTNPKRVRNNKHDKHTVRDKRCRTIDSFFQGK